MTDNTTEDASLYPAGHFPDLASTRVLLTEPDAARDLPGMFEVYRDPRVMRYCGIGPYEEPAETSEQFDWFDRVNHQGQGVRWAMLRKEDGLFIGDLGYHNYDASHHKAELGYKLGRQFWRQGLTAEVMPLVLDYGFTAMGLNRIEALVEPDNEASLGLLARFGFAREGVLRDYEYEHGRYVDLVILSLLKREWRP